MVERNIYLGLLCLAVAIAAVWMLPRSKPALSRRVKIQPEAVRTGPVEINDVTLEEAIDQLATRTRANIVVHWRDIGFSSYDPTRQKAGHAARGFV